VGCYIWYSEDGPGRAAAPTSPLIAVSNVTALPSTASVPITSGVATGESKGGQLPPALFRPDFQIRANPVRNLKGLGVGGVMINGVSQA